MLEDDTLPRGDPGDAPPSLSTPAGNALWSLRDLGIGFLAVVSLYLLVSSAIVFPALAFYDEESPEVLAAGVTATLLWNACTVLFIFWFVRRRGGSWRNLGFVPPRLGGTGRDVNWPRLAVFVCVFYVASIMVVS